MIQGEIDYPLNCSEQFVRAAAGFQQFYSHEYEQSRVDYPRVELYRSLFTAFSPGGCL